MQTPPLDPDVADLAPAEPVLTPYDHEHVVTYMRMLDADAEGADWRDVSRIVLHIDADQDVQRAKRALVTSRVRSGWRAADTGACSETAGLPRARGQASRAVTLLGPSRV